MKNIEEVTRNRFPILSDLMFVDTTLQSHDQFVAVLLNHKSNKLLDYHSMSCRRLSYSDNSLESRKDLLA